MLYKRWFLNLFKATFWLGLIWISGVQEASAESELLAKVRAGEGVKVLLLGTSLTDGGTWPESLEKWLKEESPDPGKVTLINRAVGGSASDHGVAVQTPVGLKDEPDAVFIEFSINDAATVKKITKEQARSNLNRMLDQFTEQNPEVIFVLQTMNNVAEDTGRFSSRVDLDQYYQIYRDVAKERGALLIDHYPNWLNLYTKDIKTWRSYMKDPVHPNRQGQDMVVVPELKKSLSAPLNSEVVGPHDDQLIEKSAQSL